MPRTANGGWMLDDAPETVYIEKARDGIGLDWQHHFEASRIEKFDPDQARDERGRWTDTGAGSLAVSVADKYMRSRGETYTPLVKQPLDEARATAVAAEFDKMQHTPNDPETRASYAALGDETLAQFKAMSDAGIKVEAIPEGMADPYTSAEEVAKDVGQNKHMWYYPTTSGFGSGGLDNTDNPLLADSGVKDSKGRPMLKNDVFRVVHDYFGHVKDGNSFRPDGEENAWRSHSTMFSPLARRAMTTETRAQNAWVYFGPYGAQNRAAKDVKDVHFADQKVGLLPEEYAMKRVSSLMKEAVFDESQHPRDEGGKFSEGGGGNKVYMTPGDVIAQDSWGGEKQYVIRDPKTGEPSGRLIPRPMSSEELPETLYHATTNTPAVESSGHLIAQTDGGGLGGGNSMPGVSLTTSRADADLITKELGRVIVFTKATPDTEEKVLIALRAFAREDEKAGNFAPGSLNHAVDFGVMGWNGNLLSSTRDWNGESWESSPPLSPADAKVKLQVLAKEAFQGYLTSRAREARTLLGNPKDFQTNDKYAPFKDPILFGSGDDFAKMDEHKLGVVEFSKGNLPKTALVREGSDDFLHEIRVHADVPLAGAKFSTKKDGGFGMGGGASSTFTSPDLDSGGRLAPGQGMFRKPRRSRIVNDETTRPGDGGSINPLYGGNAYILAPGKTPRVNPYESLLKAQKAVAIDFDGTITLDEQGTENPRMRALVEELLAHNVRVVIFTARPAVEVFEWLVEHEWPRLEVTNVKSRDFGVYLDDRAVNFAPGMTGAGLAEKLAGFKTWWEKSAIVKDATTAGAQPDNAHDKEPEFPAIAIIASIAFDESKHPRAPAGEGGGQFTTGAGGGAAAGEGTKPEGGEKPKLHPTDPAFWGDKPENVDQAEWEKMSQKEREALVAQNSGRGPGWKAPEVKPLGPSTQAEQDRLAAAQAAWDKEHPIHTGEGASSPQESTPDPELWDDLNGNQQDKAKNAWMDNNIGEFLRMEEENWRDDPQNFEDVPDELSKDETWTEDKIKEISASFYSGETVPGLGEGVGPTYPALVAEEARRIKEWRDNFAADESFKNGAFTTDAEGKLSVDTDKLVFRDNPYHEDTGQQMLPGIEREDMEKAYNKRMWAEGQGDFETHFKEDFDAEVEARTEHLKDNPPDFSEGARAMLEAHWDNMDDSEKFRQADVSGADRGDFGGPRPARVKGTIGPNEEVDSPEQKSIRSLTPKSAKIVRGEGISEKKIVTMADGSKFMWKPSTGEPSGVRAGIPAGQAYQRDVAAYDIGRLVGMKNFMPVATIANYEGVYGSMTVMIPNARNDSIGDDKEFVNSALRSTIFDYVIGNTDRHEGNWMTDSKGKFWSVDHGLTFSESSHDSLNPGLYRKLDDEGKAPLRAAPITEAFKKPWRGKWDKIKKIMEARGLSKNVITLVHQRYINLLKDGTKWSTMVET